MDAKTLLIFVHVPMQRHDNQLYLEQQACNGLRLWAENFERVIVMLPLETGPLREGWVPLSMVGDNLERIEVHLLPTAYRPDQFFLALPQTSRLISRLIDRADYLCFGIGGLFGDWGSVSCILAHRRHRPYAVWTDRVESEVTRRSFTTGRLRRRLMARFSQPLMARLERYVIRRARLGLFHGKDTFDTYQAFCGGHSEIVHNIHISKQDHISAEGMASKIRSAQEGPLRVCYSGRVEDMKGPFDWLDVLAGLQRASVDFHATWLGDGSLRPEMLHRISDLGLAGRVDMPGFVNDLTVVLETLRKAHIFLFCHKTPESPRCLIEALISGTPIFGYHSPYAADLISTHAGGRLTPLDDIGRLTKEVLAHAADRKLLTPLMTKARDAGSPFSDVNVFHHRSKLIKDHL